jgi:hypothetical protein
MLAEDIRSSRLKFDFNLHWADECQRIIYSRDEQDILTKEIDESFHPDMMDALLYALRPMWQSTQIKMGDTYQAPTVPTYMKEPDFLDKMHDHDDEM